MLHREGALEKGSPMLHVNFKIWQCALSLSFLQITV